MKTKTKWLIAAVAIAGLGAFTLKTVSDAGAFRDIEPHEPGPCQSVEGIVGGEDMEWRRNGREVFIAAQDRRDFEEGGKIYLMAVGGPDPQPREVTPELDFPFHPHGLSLFTGSDGTERLFVVNHRGGWDPPHTIEIFDVRANGALDHVRSVEDEALVSPNDVAAVGPDQFYVTNDHGSSSRLWHTFEDFLQLPLGNVVYFDGSTFKQVYDGTRYANGINTRPDHTEVYVAETTGQTIKVFSRDMQTNELSLEHTVEAHTGVDNIDVAQDGTLWVAAHPKMLDFLSHMSAPDARSASQILRLERDESGDWQQTEVYLNDGDPISGSAVGAVYGDQLVIGPVFDRRVVVCVLERAPSLAARGLRPPGGQGRREQPEWALQTGKPRHGGRGARTEPRAPCLLCCSGS